MDKGRLYTLIGAVFAIVGVVLLGVGAALVASTVSFMASAEQTEGTVVALTERTTSSRDSDGRSRVSTVWYPTVEYAVNGQRYSFESSAGADPPAYEEGDRVPVAYDPDDPSDARIASFATAFVAPLIVGGLAIVFTPIGGALFLKGRRIARQRAWLQQHGQEVWAEIAHIGREFTVRRSGRHPYVVHATWYDERTGRTHTATSDYLSLDRGPGLLGRTHVRVLYDPADPDRNMLVLKAVR